MSIEVEFLPGPLTSAMPRTSAERAISQHPAIREGAKYALEQMDGRWVAAIVHTAGEPPFGGGGPADAEEEAPAPKSEGPDDAEPSEGPDVPKPDSAGGGEEGPPKHEDGKGGDKGGDLHQLMQMLQQVMEALGLPVGMGDSMVPGADEGSMPPPAGPPHGPGGPMPGGPPHQPGDVATQHVVHERVTKPGETPPGGTPVGAPAFASVRSDHPWAHIAGKVASFDVTSEIGDTPLNEINSELQALASELPGYKVARLREDRDNHGQRVAVAKITLH